MKKITKTKAIAWEDYAFVRNLKENLEEDRRFFMQPIIKDAKRLIEIIYKLLRENMQLHADILKIKWQRRLTQGEPKRGIIGTLPDRLFDSEIEAPKWPEGPVRIDEADVKPPKIT